jgi:RHS repeat-associated protein
LQANDAVDVLKNTGNIAKQTLTVPGTSFAQTYKYDALQRLTEAKEPNGTGNNWSQTFGYDRFGNRTSFNQTVGTTNTTQTPAINANTNRFSSSSYQYDKNGNVTIDAQNWQYAFNGDNKQIAVKDENGTVIGQYYYDGEGNRVKKFVQSNQETTIFVYSSGKLIAEYSSQAPPNPTISYTTTDHLGSPRVITDKSGSVISRRDFMPFGEDLNSGVGNRSTTLKYALAGADNLRKRFTGYEKDTETGLDFAEARYYNNKHGRFTAVDPLLASGKSTDPQTFNRYI